MSIKSLPDKWMQNEVRAEDFDNFIEMHMDAYDCAYALKAAMPVWTKITEVNDIPKNDCVFMWAWQGADNQWVASVGINAGGYYLAEGTINALYSRPLCDLDYPPEQT